MRKYLLLAPLLFTTLLSQGQKSDEAALKRIILAETQGWLDGNETQAQQWHFTPTASLMVSSVAAEKPWFFELRGEELEQQLKGENQAREGVKLTQTNHEFRIAGKTAWVTFDEQLQYPDGRIGHSREIRLLEKVKGEWKIVLVSSHYYKPVDDGR